MSTIASLIDKQSYEQAKLQKLKNEAAKRSALKAPDNPLDWITAIYRNVFSKPFGQHHKEMFEWAWSIEPGVRPLPFCGIWPRGAGKSTSAETTAVMLGAREKRKYLLYVSETQELADSHLLAIRGMIESPVLASYYPTFAKPRVSKEGHSKGWRHNRLFTGNGFVIDSIGLDTAKRGSRIMDARPDFIIFDDLDAKGDNPAITQKKIDTITTSLLPAGSQDVAVLFIQNMIIDTGVFAKLALPNPPFMRNRILSGPFPALENFSWGQGGDGRIVIEGRPTWSGFTLETCQGIVDDIGLSAFRSEYQHEIIAEDSMYAHITFRHIEKSETPPFWRKVITIDPAVSSDDNSDSHGICVAGIADNGKIYILDSWEKRASPEFALKKGLYLSIKHGCDTLVIEANQGGDMWINLWDTVVEESGLSEDRIPGIKLVKATSSTGSKIERGQQLLVDYERGQIFHVLNNETNSHVGLEAALRRFPIQRPLDLADAVYWAWSELRASGWVFA